MIEINLLPGAGKKKSGRSGGGTARTINIGAMLAGIAQKIRDPWLISAVGSVALAAVVIGGTFTYQSQRVSSLGEAEKEALADSARYAAALKERAYSAVMAATGLLYLAILTAFGTDLVARAILAG